MPARVPNKINMIENPRIKKTPLRNIFLRTSSRFVSSYKSSLETPLINPKYAGTSGSVHGARNVSSPAKNAENISPNPIISIYYSRITYL